MSERQVKRYNSRTKDGNTHYANKGGHLQRSLAHKVRRKDVLSEYFSRGLPGVILQEMHHTTISFQVFPEVGQNHSELSYMKEPQSPDSTA